MNNQIRLKSADEILARLKELVSRYRRRFLHRYLRPCPNNCSNSEVLGGKVIRCRRCGSQNPEFCKAHDKFTPLATKEQLATQFNAMMKDPQILLQDYRDLVAFLFVLGYFDKPQAVPEHIIQDKA